MQNLPDKGVSGFDHYLQADRTVTGLTGIVPESQGERRGRSKGISILGHGMTENLRVVAESGEIPRPLGSKQASGTRGRVPMTHTPVQ